MEKGPQLAIRRCRHRSADEICDQPVFAIRQRAGDDRAVGDAGMAGERGFDLAQLDAEAADFHLLVGAAEIFEIAVGGAAGEVAAAIKARAGFPRMRDETLGGQLGPAQVAAGHAVAADVQFAREARGAGIERGVEDVEIEVRDGLADAAALGRIEIGARDWAVGDMHGRLGDAVHIDQARGGVAVPVEPRPQRGEVERRAAENDRAERERQAERGVVLDTAELEKGEWGLVENGDFFLRDERVKLRGAARDEIRHDDESAAVSERAPDFPDGEIEGRRVEERPDIGGGEVEPVLRGLEQADDVVMGDGDAFGHAGGARGVDDVRRVGGRGEGRGVFG